MTYTIRCTRCAATDQTSRLTIGRTVSTLLATDDYYDQTGILHRHDPNWHTTFYECSRGHQLMASRMTVCPAGDYGGAEQLMIIEQRTEAP